MACMVGKGLILRGELSGDGDLHVQGHVEGKINVAGTVVIQEGASVQADISATEIIVAGVVRGNLAASSKIELSPTGYLVGDVRSPALIVREGAAVNGRLSVEADLSPARVFAEMARLIHEEEGRDV